MRGNSSSKNADVDQGLPFLPFPEKNAPFHKTTPFVWLAQHASYFLYTVFECMGRGEQTKPVYPLAAGAALKLQTVSIFPSREALEAFPQLRQAEATCDDFTLRRPNWGTVMTLPLNPTSIKRWLWFKLWIILSRRAPVGIFKLLLCD